MYDDDDKFDHVNNYTYDCAVPGVKVEDALARPETTLLSYLRNTLGLCGTKLGCGEGGCGACTVMLSQYRVVLPSS